MPRNKSTSKLKKTTSKQESYAKPDRLSLTGFRSTQVPDVMPMKLVYSDFRTLVSAGSTGYYVYRLMSLFDPDFTGVGGQPDGFDLWKTLYNNYRVVAVDVEVEFVCTTALVGLCAMAPSTGSATLGNAEELSGQRHSLVGEFAAGVKCTLKKRYYISEVLGWSDETVLAADSAQAAIGANPGTQCFLHVATETGGASDSVNMFVRLCYYARLENPVPSTDSYTLRRRRLGLASANSASSDTSGAHPVVPVPSNETETESHTLGSATTTPENSTSVAIAAVHSRPQPQQQLPQQQQQPQLTVCACCLSQP